MTQLFTSGGQSIGVSASRVLPMNIQDWAPLGWTVGSPCCPRDSQESSPTPQFKSINSLVLSLLYGPTLTLYMTTGKIIALTIGTFVGKVMPLLFNPLSGFVIAFFARTDRRISSVQLLSRVRLFVTLWTAPCQVSLSITNSQSLLKLMSIKSVMPSSHLILCCPPPPTPNPSQHQGLFQWVNSSHEVAKVLGFQLQHQSFQWTFRVGFPLGLTGLISLLSKGLSRVFSSTTIQKHQFFGAQPSLWSNFHTSDITDKNATIRMSEQS